MKWLRALIVAVLCLVPVGAGAWWQSVAQQTAGVVAGYQGPGNVVSGALIWGSCARGYSSATAAGTSMCDLVDSAAPTTVICTLKLGSDGFVDLVSTANCTGSVTPSAKCAAATGGVCNVQKVYDQIGGTSGWVQNTAANQPVLTFSAINSLPGWTCTAAANKALITSTTFGSGGTVAISSPFTWVAVGERTSNTGTAQSLLGWSTAPNGLLGFNNAAATAVVTADNASKVTRAAADSAFHALIGVIDATTTGVLAVDGAETTGTTATSVPANVTARVCRSAGGLSLDGIMMEAGIWGSAISSGNRALLNSNMHGANGYNF